MLQVLDEIVADRQPRLICLNKLDKLDHNADLLVFQERFPGSVAISAATGRGLDRLVERVRGFARGGEQELTLRVHIADGKALHFLENRTKVLDREYENEHVNLTVRIGQRVLDQLKAMGTSAEIPGEEATATRGWGR